MRCDVRGEGEIVVSGAAPAPTEGELQRFAGARRGPRCGDRAIRAADYCDANSSTCAIAAGRVSAITFFGEAS
jgi:hypothetical protein